MDAKYSIPFSTAIAVAGRKVVIQGYSVEGLKDPVVLELAQKVTPRIDEAYNRGLGRSAGKVEIRTKDGKVYSQHTDLPYGHPKRPMTWEDVVHKFQDCLYHTAKPVPRDNMEKVIDMVGKLEDVADAGQIVRLLA